MRRVPTRMRSRFSLVGNGVSRMKISADQDWSPRPSVPSIRTDSVALAGGGVVHVMVKVPQLARVERILSMASTAPLPG